MQSNRQKTNKKASIVKSFSGLLLANILLLTSCQNEGNAQPVSSAPDARASKVTWDVQQGNNWYRPSGQQEFYVLLTVKGGDAAVEKGRTPLNISVVVDRSGSMSGDKIKYAQKAVNFLVDQLGSTDRLSIVDYDDVVELISKQQTVQNKEMLKMKVNQLKPRGSTNLSGGVMEGYTQVNSLNKSGYVNRVLLMTDGIANAGISEPEKLKQIVDKKFAETGIGLSTFGVGADYNEDLLTMMAETGRGNYYFIDQADKIPDIFAKELKGLLNVVAQNTYVQLSLPNNIVCEHVFGYPYKTINAHTINISFNDVFANEEKVILVKLRSTSVRNEAFDIVGTMHYTDASTFNESSTKFVTTFTPSNDLEKIAGGKNKKVEEMIALYESASEFDKVMEDVDKKDYNSARSKAGNALRSIKEKQAAAPSAKLKAQEVKLENYMEQLNDIESRGEAEQKIIQKAGKAANYNTKKNK